MKSSYQSLDRGVHATIFLASLLVAFGLFTSVAAAFGPLGETDQNMAIEEVVVLG